MSIYLDNASTTKVCKEAAEAVLYAMTEEFGNPSSGHLKGRQAKKLVDEAREKTAIALGAEPGEIYFTAGGTEANNWALISGANLMARKGRHIVSTTVEHDAVRKPLEALSKMGFQVQWIRPDKDGSIPLDRFEQAIGAETALVTVMTVCNETGNVYPISEISEIIKMKRSPALLHTDAVQGFLKLPFSAFRRGADLITISAHKIHGPKGVGALYIKKGLKLPPLIFGGGQERGYRSGTESVPLIAGFGAAVEAGFVRAAENISEMEKLKNLLQTELLLKIPESRVIGKPQAPHILALSLPGYQSEVLLNYLDAKGIYVSKGSACKKGKRSHVLEEMGLNADMMDAVLRVSLSHDNTSEEITCFTDTLAEAKKRVLPKLK